MEVFEAGQRLPITLLSNNDGRRRSGNHRHRGIVEGGADRECDGREAIVYRLRLLFVVVVLSLMTTMMSSSSSGPPTIRDCTTSSGSGIMPRRTKF